MCMCVCLHVCVTCQHSKAESCQAGSLGDESGGYNTVGTTYTTKKANNGQLI